MVTLSVIFEPSFKITISTIIATVLWFIFLLVIYRMFKGKKNFDLVKAELSITNPKLYFELNKDKDKERLILENGLLQEEVKALERRNSNLSFMSVIMLFITIISLSMKNKKK
jgi:hypothetical protein